MLTMRSTHRTPTHFEDLTTRARIRDVALARFPIDGFGATTIRAIAANAGVSPALVVHHFGSKEGLREACDHFVVARFRETKLAAMEEGNVFDPGFAATALQMAQPLLRYFGWALSRNHPAAGDLFDEMVREGLEVTRIAVEKGMIHDSPDLERRTAVQMALNLGMLVMHAHLERNTGVDVLSAGGIAELTPTLFEIFGGMFTPEVREGIEAAYGDARSLVGTASSV
jgi:AcrR family transcriptional regulator